MKIILNYKQPVFDVDNEQNTRKILKYELHTKYILESNFKITGADIFDDIDDLIIQKKPKLHKESETKTTHKKGTTINVKEYKINKNMSIFDLQKIIYNLTNITVQNQHIEQLINGEYHNVQYSIENIDLMIDLDTCLNNLLTYNNTNLYDIPLDINFINNRHLYTIKEFSKIKKIRDLDIDKILEIDIFNINDFILDKNHLYTQLKTDDENMNSVYHGFVERYFAYFTLDMFKYYLQSYNIIDIYPSLYIEKNVIKNKLNLLNKYSSIKVKKNEYKTDIKVLNIKVESYSTIKTIVLQNVFNLIELQKFSNIHKVEGRLNINDKIVYLEKINLLDTKYTTSKLILEKRK